MKSRVFIPQQSNRRKAGGEWKPAIDLSPAYAYGDPVVMMPSGPVALAAQPLVFALRRKLMGRYLEDDFDQYANAEGKLPAPVPFNKDDYLVAVGNPTVFAIATAVAAEINNGIVQMLYWDNRIARYVEVVYNVRS